MQREALKKAEHQEGQSKSIPPSFQSKSHVLLFVIQAEGIVPALWPGLVMEKVLEMA